MEFVCNGSERGGRGEISTKRELKITPKYVRRSVVGYRVSGIAKMFPKRTRRDALSNTVKRTLLIRRKRLFSRREWRRKKLRNLIRCPGLRDSAVLPKWRKHVKYYDPVRRLWKKSIFNCSKRSLLFVNGPNSI